MRATSPSTQRVALWATHFLALAHLLHISCSVLLMDLIEGLQPMGLSVALPASEKPSSAPSSPVKQKRTEIQLFLYVDVFSALRDHGDKVFSFSGVDIEEKKVVFVKAFDKQVAKKSYDAISSFCHEKPKATVALAVRAFPDFQRMGEFVLQPASFNSDSIRLVSEQEVLEKLCLWNLSDAARVYKELLSSGRDSLIRFYSHVIPAIVVQYFLNIYFLHVLTSALFNPRS